ncbi:MAG: DUF4105 domain-containing protein [Cyclobacteriaceae bacterium]|nr:DUF4105 domain-containing protein [Cyclobacteriaceae bacterium]
MKNILFSLFLCPSLLFGQTITLSDLSEISVITCGPGQDELYAAFGHSAFRVHDRDNGIDYLYNYGVFDFDQPNFYLNFARGFLNYKIARMDYPPFRDHYIYYNRSVTEQVLNLSTEDKQKLFDFLEWNNQPENQYYLYDYFYDNCATRIRDALKTVFKERINFDGSYITTDKTIRNLTDDYLGQQPWGDLGIDICLGMPMDKKATPYMYMFLPDYVKSGLDHANLQGPATVVPMVKQTIVTYEAKDLPLPKTWATPTTVFWSIFLLTALFTILDFRRKRYTKAIDLAWFSITGLFGCFLLALWLATDHRAAAWNLNLLWAFPFHLAAVVLLLKKPGKILTGYLKFSLVLSGLVVVSWFFLPQLMHYSLFPLALLSLVRSYTAYRWYSR